MSKFIAQPTAIEAAREIVELHEFFEGWLGGTMPADDDHFQRLEQALASPFTFIGPDARCIDRDTLVSWLRNAHGSRPSLRIRIERPVVRIADGDLLLATYEEWQRDDGGDERARLSTVLMRRTPSAPNGLQWLHVHETWMSSGGDAS